MGKWRMARGMKRGSNEKRAERGDKG